MNTPHPGAGETSPEAATQAKAGPPHPGHTKAIAVIRGKAEGRPAAPGPHTRGTDWRPRRVQTQISDLVARLSAD